MANQKITDLNTLKELDEEDLFIVVDRDSKSNSSSPTGETKGISAVSLATQLNNIANGETGIDFKNLRDVPNSYEEHKDGYVKINKDGSGIEFTESPGASERTFNYNTQFISDEYNIGDVLRISNNKLTKASSAPIEASSANPDGDNSEAIGIIKKIKLTHDTNNIESISVVFNGMIEWDYDSSTDVGPVNIEKKSFDPNDTSLTKVFNNQVLIPGHTYFLGSFGTLAEFDPADTSGLDHYVSKPMLVANGPASGVVVNYRGLVCNQDEGVNKFTIPVSAECNSIKVGDVLRIKRTRVRTQIDQLDNSFFDETGLDENVLPSFIGREGGTTSFALCNSASQNKTTGENAPIEDDSYGCDMLGIVTNATTDSFEIQTSGMVEFNLPHYETDVVQTLNNGTTITQTQPITGLFLSGYTYYVESFPVNNDPSASTNQSTELRSSIYDYTPEDLGVKIASDADPLSTPSTLVRTLQPLMDGTSPFRNTTLVNPFERDTTSGHVISYSKPAFYALSPSKILILNQPAYPNPKDRCNAIDPQTGIPCVNTARESKSFSINRVNKFPNDSAVESFSSDFLKVAWPTAYTRDEAVITYIFEITDSDGNITTEFESYRMSKIVSGIDTNWTLTGRVA